MNQIIGYGMIASMFIVLYFLAASELGYKLAAIIFLGAAALISWIGIAVFLMDAK
jgi:hypothetical protein